jgi:chromosomal replication initiation ATPase DnaA
MEKIKKIMWISGRCGYGKTAFANSIIKEFERENKKTLKLDGDDFISFLIKNIKTRNPISSFVSYLQSYDLLVLDDIDYCLSGKPATQRKIKELIEKTTNNNKTKVVLITQKRARKVRKLKFDSDKCSYLRIKAPSADFKRSLIKEWFKKEDINIPRKKTEEAISNFNNLFQLKGFFNKIKFSRKVKINREAKIF